MGGSSLAPEVMRRAVGAEAFHVLDSTHPAAIRSLESRIDPDDTLFIVSSKSGTTLETRCHLDYFWHKDRKFAAVTDPGSELEALGRERGFAAVVWGEPTIGGRYSALSPFGLVPGALMGLDVERLMEGAAEMQEACRTDRNPGLDLGLALGRAWLEGRDKVVVPEGNGFGLWLEQLLAESTGKDGKGLVPAPGESPEGADRQKREVEVGGVRELGAELYRWEFATAVAGTILEINPFDQPNVQEAKDRTLEVLSGHGQVPGTGTRPEGTEAVEELLAGAQPGDYIAVLAFIDPEREGGAATARGEGAEHRVRRHRRARPAVPALDRPAAQGRPAERALRPGGGRPGRRAGDPRAAVRLPHPDPRAGRGGPRRPGGAGTPYRSRDTRRPGGAMKLGMVGLGRMGANMVERLRQGGHEVETYARTAPERTADSLVELATKLEQPRVVWLMIPSGDPTEKTFQTLLPMLEDGDTVVDGGNSNFRDSIRRAEQAKTKGVSFLDAGVSGGIWGLAEGYCIMAGGEESAFQAVEPALATLAPESGYAHVGPSGAGHFVKMVHNGIEYGLMEAYAEGFDLLQGIPDFELDLQQLAALWQHGSVVRSWLLELLDRALQADPGLEEIRGYVEDSGEGRWTVHEAVDAAVPVPVLALSLFARFSSRQDESFAAKVNAALRNQFGGHAVEAAKAKAAE